MATLNAVAVSSAAGITDLAATAVAAAGGGDTAPCGPGHLLAVINGGATPQTVTVATPGKSAGFALADATLTVPAGKTGLLALGNAFRGVNDRAAITYSGVTSMTVAVIKLKGA
ncbi:MULTISPECIES: hypothetical protein [unclassified Streptomyces]|uniref:hypothetical protein n=1 Tax=unclassified Streptomyces TaxID=2593676 RepID=UPI0035DC3EB8